MDVQIVVLCCPDSQSCDQSIEDYHSITHRNPRDTLAVDYSCHALLSNVKAYCERCLGILLMQVEIYTCVKLLVFTCEAFDPY
jgi:hypothetical protein